jgi:plastocyanin
MNKKRIGRFGVLAIAAIAVLAMPGVSTGATSTVKATGQEKWDPSFKHIEPGGKIVWKNPTGKTHDVHSYRSDWNKSVILSPGERTSKTFKKEGVFRYRCKIHSSVSGGQCSGMCGTIHVEDY